MSNLTSWNPFGGLTRVRDEVNDLLGRFPMAGAFDPGSNVLLPIDVSEADDTLVAKAEIPGMKADAIDVSVTDNVLTIKGEKKEEKESKENGFVRKERSFGAFVRSVTLPCEVDATKTDATYKDGVLRVEMPKVATAKPKKIKVK